MADLKPKSLKRKLDCESEEPPSRKEMKTEEQLDSAVMSTSGDGLGLFNNIIQEMFEEILSYLGVKDILGLCLSSKTMNQLIGNNERIMRRITLTFPKVDKLTDIDDSQRIYRNIAFIHQIKIHNFRTALPYIEKISSNARNIELRKKQSIYVSLNIIKQFKDATKIRAIFKGINYTKKTTAIQVPHLKDLEVNGSLKIFVLFQNCKLLEKLSFTGHTYERENILLLKEFLIKQTQLKSLNIENGYGLFEDNKLADSNFKLKELGISTYWESLTPENKVNFQNFLNLSRNTLEKFTTRNRAILEEVRDFPNLKTVVLQLQTYRHLPIVLENMPFVEVLSVTNKYKHGPQTLQLSVENLRNLKEFNGKLLKMNSSLDHSSIEKLDLESCSFTNLKMPNLRSAKFSNIEFPPEFQLNDTIQTLILDKCKNVENLLSFIEQPDVKLKLFEISRTTLSNRRMIIANKHKIQRLIINNKVILRSSKN